MRFRFPDQRQPPEPFLEDDPAMDLGEEEPEMGWPTLELEKADVQAQINVEGQNLRHPMRIRGSWPTSSKEASSPTCPASPMSSWKRAGFCRATTYSLP